MTEKEKQVDEVAVILSPLCDEEDEASCKACNEKDKERCGECIYREMAEALYSAGYRKQSDTINECIAWLKDHAHYDEEWSLVDAFCECFQEDEQ